jgi:hypothetical protein
MPRTRDSARRRAARQLVLLTGCTLLPLGCGDDDDDGWRNGNPAGVGNHCATDADCATGECYVGPGGGYCTSPCSTEGDISECPPDTVCKPIQGGPRRCLLICGSESSCYGLDECPTNYCPDGSSCVTVSNTDHMACEPDPT